MIRFYTLSIIISSISFSEISPLLTAKYYSTGGEYTVDSKELYNLGAGIKFSFRFDSLSIKGDFTNNRFFGFSQYSANNINIFNRNESIAYKGGDLEGDKFDYDMANIIVQYNYKPFELLIGKFNEIWNSSSYSLIYSHKLPSQPKFGYNLKINKKLKYYYRHIKLKSNIVDSLNSNFYKDNTYFLGGSGNRIKTVDKYSAIHKIQYSSDKFRISFCENVIYGSRSIDMTYLIPMVPIWSLQHYSGDLDNLQMNIEILYLPNKRSKLYLNLLIDEWRPKNTFKGKKNGNWFAYQLGFAVNTIFKKSDNLVVEYTWLDSRVARHRFSINDSYHEFQPFGFWSGPNSEDIHIFYQIPFKTFSVNVIFNNTIRGDLTQEMLSMQYNSEVEYKNIRYSQFKEQKIVGSVSFLRNFFLDSNIELGLKYINWQNGGCNPYINDCQNIETKSRNKLSIEIGIIKGLDI